ncbi:MAG: DMT family transporter [Gammaproteobacteria bacterium]|nr:DMT family transporter [Gammaproteobacteria bacterium]MDH3449397.1 DMT family transporter [Gammaproteobacteria bacterium]
MTDIAENADHPALGIVLMLIGIASFAVMDATVKWLAAEYPVIQVAALRSWFGLPLLCLFALRGGGLRRLQTKRPGLHIGRYLLVLGLTLSFFWALTQMKLVDAIAISFAAPIFITALSMPLLRESVGLHRWLAVGIGFIGVLVMLRPGPGVFQWAALVVLASVAFYALLMITTRAFKNSENSAALMLYPQLGMSLTGILLAPFFWVTPNLVDLGLFALAGTFGSVGVMCVTHAFRLGPAAVITPFEYSALIWATLLGYFLWGELPDPITLLGAAIVIASGLYIVYRETVRIGRARSQLTSMSPDDSST